MNRAAPPLLGAILAVVATALLALAPTAEALRPFPDTTSAIHVFDDQLDRPS